MYVGVDFYVHRNIWVLARVVDGFPIYICDGVINAKLLNLVWS